MVTRGSPKPLFWVRVLVPLPSLDSNFDTKLESSFFISLANTAHKMAYQAAYLKFGHESHPLLQNATSSLYRPDVAFSVFRAVI